MRNLLLLELCALSTEYLTEYPKSPDYSCNCMWKKTKQTSKVSTACPVQKVWRSEQTSLLLMVQESPPAWVYFQHWPSPESRAVALGRHRGPHWAVRWHSRSYFLWLCIIDTFLSKHTYVICVPLTTCCYLKVCDKARSFSQCNWLTLDAHQAPCQSFVGRRVSLDV